MAYYHNQSYQKTELTHKQIILQQILICNSIFSGYEASPTSADKTLGTYDFTPQAHTGKAILLAVLTLEANARAILPEEYPPRVENIKQKIFEPIRCEYLDTMNNKRTYEGLGIIAPDPAEQLNAILDVHKMYTEILAAIYSLPKFSDAIPVHQIAQGENITEEEIGEKESIEYSEEDK